MQYPFPANNSNVDSTRNSVKTNNTEKQNQDSNNNSNGDFNHNLNRNRDTGKINADNSSIDNFAMNSTQQQNNTNNQSTYGVCAKPIVSDGCEQKYSQGKCCVTTVTN